MSKSFIEGKWYLYKHPDEDFYLRSREKSTDIIYYSEWVAPKRNNINYGYGRGSYENSCVTNQEIPIDIVKEFLPKNHPDLEITSVIKNTEYLGKLLKKLNIK